MKGLLTEMCSGRAGVGAVLRGKRGTSLQEVVSTGPGAAEEGYGMPRPRGTGQGRRCGGHRLAQVRGELPQQAKWGRGTPPSLPAGLRARASHPPVRTGSGV